MHKDKKIKQLRPHYGNKYKIQMNKGQLITLTSLPRGNKSNFLKCETAKTKKHIAKSLGSQISPIHFIYNKNKFTKELHNGNKLKMIKKKNKK